MIQSNPDGENYQLELKSITRREEEKSVALEFLNEFRNSSRLDCRSLLCPGIEVRFFRDQGDFKDAQMVYWAEAP